MPSTGKEQPEAAVQQMLRMRPSYFRRLIWRVVDAYDNVNWLHVAFKACAFSYIALNLWLAWQILPVHGHWNLPARSGKVAPVSHQDHSSYFGSFKGAAECGIRANNLYDLALHHKIRQPDSSLFCASRKALLKAMSEGGRVGFDAPYIPKDCYYRWFSVEELCFILDRFDGIVFVGDSFLQAIYSGFNMLLRRDLAAGAIKTDVANCRCDMQFINPDCSRDLVSSSEQADGYSCSGKPHALLALDKFPAPAETVAEFKKVVPNAPRSRYQPIAIIHSVSPLTMSQEDAGQSLLEFLRLADQSRRRTPMLWVGPTAAGHIDLRDRKGNQEIWDFDTYMARVAGQNDVEALHMWNLTVQASSHDGLHFGSEVALVQAMMLFNWLSRLPSS